MLVFPCRALLNIVSYFRVVMEYKTLYYKSVSELDNMLYNFNGSFIRGIYRDGSLISYLRTSINDDGGVNHIWHRIDGPAHISRTYNDIGFYIDDVKYSCTVDYCTDAGMTGEETLLWVLKYGEWLPYTIDGFYGEDWQLISVENF